jgi:phage terminase small subunit
MARKCTEQEERFAVETVTGVDQDGKSISLQEAYKRVYKGQVTDKTCYEMASRVRARPHVDARVNELRELAAEKAVINRDYVLNRLVEIDQMDALDILNDDGSIKPIRAWPKVWRQYLSGIEVVELSSMGDDDDKKTAILKKIKWPDKVRNLELIGRTVGAFIEKVEHTSPDGSMTPKITAIDPIEAAKQYQDIMNGKF